MNSRSALQESIIEQVKNLRSTIKELEDEHQVSVEVGGCIENIRSKSINIAFELTLKE